MDSKFTVELSDGTKIQNLDISGNTFICSENISQDIFKGKLKHVNIYVSQQGDNNLPNNMAEYSNLLGQHENMKLISFMHGWKNEFTDFYDGKILFSLIPMTPQELRDLNLDSRLDYLEMMNEF